MEPEEVKLRSHTMKSVKALQTIQDHTALKRFNDIVATTIVIVFLAVIAML